MTQKTCAPLRRRTVALAVSSALAAFSAASAFADPMLQVKLFRDTDVLFRDADMSRWADNYVEFGLGYNSDASYRFGQFSGLTEQGGFPIAGFNWLRRDGANDAQYWRVYGSNLGLDSRKLLAEGGVQGRWNVMLSVDQLQKSQTDTAQFMHDGLGTNNLTLPNGFLNSSNVGVTGMNNARIVPFLKTFDIQQNRDIYRVGFDGLLSKNWDYKVVFREDRRDGTRLTGYPFNTGQAVIVPYAIDDRTDQLEATLSYTSKDAQLQFGYTYSRYDNDAQRLRVQSPLANTGTAPNLNPLESQMSQAPSNDYHQLNATGAYNFSKTTRLNTTVSYGVARQNESFFPYSVNGTAATTALPRDSLDGKVINTLLDVALTTKPIDKLNLKVAYQYRDSDNRTPIAQYTYAGRDALSVATTGGGVRTNAPLSTSEQRFVVDGDYQIAPRTVLRAGLEHSEKKYQLADRTKTETDKLSLELRRPVSDEFLGSVGYTRTQRRGSEYDKNTFFRNSYTATGFNTNTTGGSLTNHPSMRSFMYSDFDEDRVRASGNWTVSETVSLQGGFDHAKQHYKGPECGRIIDVNVDNALAGTLPDSCLGRTGAESTGANFDLQWQPDETLTTFAFLNFSETRMRQAGRTWALDSGTTGTALAPIDESLSASDPQRDWFGRTTYRDHAMGLGLKWQIEENWDIGGSYVFNYGVGKTAVAQSAAPAAVVGAASGNANTLAASTPVPNTWNKLHALQLFAKWNYSKQMDLRFNYMYENLKAYDWAYDGVAAASNANVLLTGQTSPRYSNHVFGVSAVVKSW